MTAPDYNPFPSSYDDNGVLLLAPMLGFAGDQIVLPPTTNNDLERLTPSDGSYVVFSVTQAAVDSDDAPRGKLTCGGDNGESCAGCNDNPTAKCVSVPPPKTGGTTAVAATHLSVKQTELGRVSWYDSVDRARAGLAASGDERIYLLYQVNGGSTWTRAGATWTNAGDFTPPNNVVAVPISAAT